MDIEIRAAHRKDMDMIWKATTETVWNDIPAEERAVLDRPAFEAHFRPRAKEIMESEDSTIVVASTSSGALLGYAIVGGWSSMLTPNPCGFLYDLWVAPEARRQGVARRLLEEAEVWCRLRGYHRIQLEVAAPNAAARGLYAAEGFAEERLVLGKRL